MLRYTLQGFIVRHDCYVYITAIDAATTERGSVRGPACWRRTTAALTSAIAGLFPPVAYSEVGGSSNFTLHHKENHRGLGCLSAHKKYVVNLFDSHNKRHLSNISTHESVLLKVLLTYKRCW